MTPFQAIDAFHTPDTLISPGQAFAIGSAIAASGEKPNVLVFGCGNDTALWCAMNENGYVLFLENNAGWLERTRQRFPQANIEPIAYGDTTVATSLPISEDKLAAVPVPEAVRRCVWDVILVDSPRGYKPHDPGRSLSIYWTSRVAGPRTQIFIDDYDRLLERDYTNHFIRSKRVWNLPIPRLVKGDQKARGTMLWSMGLPHSNAQSAFGLT